jgi:hypothetical protein
MRKGKYHGKFTLITYQEDPKGSRCVDLGGRRIIKKKRLGHAVAQLVQAPRHKPEGRGLDYRWYHWNFSMA